MSNTEFAKSRYFHFCDLWLEYPQASSLKDINESCEEMNVNADPDGEIEKLKSSFKTAEFSPEMRAFQKFLISNYNDAAYLDLFCDSSYLGFYEDARRCP